MSENVSFRLLWSVVPAAGVFVNDESFRMPHEARMFGAYGTRTLCVTSTTESTTPLAPQYTLKSAVRSTFEVMPSMRRIGLLEPNVRYDWMPRGGEPAVIPAAETEEATLETTQ